VNFQLLSFRALAVLALLFALAPAGVGAAGQQGLGAPANYLDPPDTLLAVLRQRLVAPLRGAAAAAITSVGG
jgi:hypothetical protein